MFRILRIATMAAVAAFASLAAAQNAIPALLMNAVSATQAAKIDYAFDFDLDTSKQNWRAHYDPSANPRLRLVQPRRDELDGGERRAFDRLAADIEGVSWCASGYMGRIADVRLVREDEVSAVYSFQPTPESIRSEQARRFANRLRGELTLTKAAPDISRVRIYAPQPFEPLPLTRIDDMNIVVACQTAPNGRHYAAETVTTVRGSALGQDFNERSVQRARNLAAP